MSIYTLELSQKDAAAAAGVTSRSVQNWMERDYIVGHRGGGIQGKNRTFTFNAVMQLAMTEALIVAGFSEVKKAAAAAADFAHGGGGGAIYDLPERDPAFPFHPNYGHTIFAVGPLGSHEELWVRPKPGDPGTQPRDTYGNLRHRVGAGMVTVEAFPVFIGVVDRLGFVPGDVLDAAYPEAVNA